MEGLDTRDSRFVGAFRGEPGLEKIQVRVGSIFGVDSAKVAEELGRFEAKLQRLVAELDALLPSGQEPDVDQLAAIIDLCAWVHAEWVRIHPFANGNGRTARLWANSLAMRYGVPPFIRLRPRPDAG
jgi:Fic family protein